MLYAEPGPEARDAVAAVWLAQLAERFPGRHFRLLTEHERRSAMTRCTVGNGDKVHLHDPAKGTAACGVYPGSAVHNAGGRDITCLHTACRG